MKADESIYRFVHHELVILVVLIAMTVVAFGITHRFAAANEALRLRDGQAWYVVGEEALQRGDLPAAQTAFRRAASTDSDNKSYRLALANVLMLAQQDTAARQLLLTLRERFPDDPETNLQLARLAARGDDRDAAGRYYASAIVGLWTPAERPQQLEVRAEFVQFLLQHGERDRAVSELLVLDASLPDESPLALSVGKMLLEAGEARRASTLFARMLQHDPADQAAREGAAEASFALGDYQQTGQYLSALEHQTDRTRELRTLVTLVLTGDPLAPRLAMSERRLRFTRALAQVVTRLQACQTRAADQRMDANVDLEPTLAELTRLQSELTTRGRPMMFDEIESGFETIVQGERLADQACGSPEPADRALLLIAQRRLPGAP